MDPTTRRHWRGFGWLVFFVSMGVIVAALAVA